MRIEHAVAVMTGEATETAAADDSCINPMDEAAFERLYRDTAARLRCYLRRACRDGALADDLLQETYFKVLRTTLPPLDDRQTKAYLYRTASSLLMDHWRRQKRERRWRLLEIFSDRAPAPDAVSTDRLGGDVASAFGGLKPQEQTLLWLAYVEGFDHREIAAMMNLREGSIRVLLFRARRRLAGLFGRQRVGGKEQS